MGCRWKRSAGGGSWVCGRRRRPSRWLSHGSARAACTLSSASAAAHGVVNHGLPEVDAGRRRRLVFRSGLSVSGAAPHAIPVTAAARGAPNCPSAMERPGPRFRERSAKVATDWRCSSPLRDSRRHCARSAARSRRCPSPAPRTRSNADSGRSAACRFRDVPVQGSRDDRAADRDLVWPSAADRALDWCRSTSSAMRTPQGTDLRAAITFAYERRLRTRIKRGSHCFQATPAAGSSLVANKPTRPEGLAG